MKKLDCSVLPPVSQMTGINPSPRNYFSRGISILILAFIGAGLSTEYASGTSPVQAADSQDSTAVAAQDSIPTLMRNEISFGLGAAYSPEKDLFNVPNDVAAGTNVGISITYLQNLNDRVALGVNIYGYFKSIDNAMLTTSGGTKEYTLSVSTFNLGVECRYFFSRDKIRPYGLLLLSYSTGSLSNSELGSLRLSGISGGGGIGADISLGQHWALALEGIASFGTAKWEQPPFTNSTGDDFNPTMYVGLVRVSYLWE